MKKKLIQLKNELKIIKELGVNWDEKTICSIEQQIKEESLKEEQFCKQKSRVDWLQLGDKILLFSTQPPNKGKRRRQSVLF